MTLAALEAFAEQVRAVNSAASMRPADEARSEHCSHDPFMRTRAALETRTSQVSASSLVQTVAELVAPLRH